MDLSKVSKSGGVKYCEVVLW